MKPSVLSLQVNQANMAFWLTFNLVTHLVYTLFVLVMFLESQPMLLNPAEELFVAFCSLVIFCELIALVDRLELLQMKTKRTHTFPNGYQLVLIFFSSMLCYSYALISFHTSVRLTRFIGFVGLVVILELVTYAKVVKYHTAVCKGMEQDLNPVNLV